MSGIDTLKTAILSKDKELVKEELTALKDIVLTDDETMAELTSPAVITELHEMLVEHLGVNQRLMQLRNRVPHRRRRAALFAQAMLNGVTYLG